MKKVIVFIPTAGYRPYVEMQEAYQNAKNYLFSQKPDIDFREYYCKIFPVHSNRNACAGHAIEIPNYDFTTHTRTSQTHHVETATVVIVEGILVFVEPELREQFDVKLYVDTDADVRFIRRLRRDVEERGRSVESVCEQYLSTVRPMHLEFVEPSKRHADVIIPEGGFNEVAIEMIAARIRGMLEEGEQGTRCSIT